MSGIEDECQWVAIEAITLVHVWKLQVTGPYLSCYGAAEAQFKKTLALQEAENKRRAELVVAALALASGSVLTAVFASTSVAAIAGDLALSAICKHNLNRTFDAYAFLANKPAVGFFAGGLVTAGSNELGKQVGDAVRKRAQDQGLASPRPLASLRDELDGFLSENAIRGADLASSIASLENVGEEKKRAALPSSKNYPRSSKSGNSRRDIQYKQLGGIVEDRINELYRKCLGKSKPLLPSNWFAPNNTRETVVAAEQGLKALASKRTITKVPPRRLQSI